MRYIGMVASEALALSGGPGTNQRLLRIWRNEGVNQFFYETLGLDLLQPVCLYSQPALPKGYPASDQSLRPTIWGIASCYRDRLG